MLTPIPLMAKSYRLDEGKLLDFANGNLVKYGIVKYDTLYISTWHYDSLLNNYRKHLLANGV